MEQEVVDFEEISFHPEHHEGTGRIWKTFWLLLTLTICELGLGLLMYSFHFSHWVLLLIKGVIVILTLAKAFYIVSIFMHLGDEIRNLIMTIVVPLMLFIWFIAAFLWDGSSFRTLRNRYDRHHLETTSPRTPESVRDTTTHPLQ
jgi:cytochrome c oxidase subunit 4